MTLISRISKIQNVSADSESAETFWIEPRAIERKGNDCISDNRIVFFVFTIKNRNSKFVNFSKRPPLVPSLNLGMGPQVKDGIFFCKASKASSCEMMEFLVMMSLMMFVCSR